MCDYISHMCISLQRYESCHMMHCSAGCNRLHNCGSHDFLPFWPGVPGEKQTLNATVAYFIGCGLAEQVAKRRGLSTQSLRISVSHLNCPW